jgi:EAL domain-containing protein (putative c-di-GMP-specific phosphodiesterase class I)
VLLLEGVEGEAEAARRAEEIQGALAAPVDVGGYEVFTSASIGIALTGGDGAGRPQHLLRDADAAMYRARALGAERHAVFDRSMHSEALRRLQLETELRRAVDRGEFRVFYQPVVELETGRTRGWEALVRWDHPERGLVGPDEFIGAAEDKGLIVPLGRWVLGEACRQLQTWQDGASAAEPLFVCVNLSARQFLDPRLLAEVEAAVTGAGLPPGSLKLELTESTVMRDAQAAAALLRRLRTLGIQIYLDDFGTGYSSLSHLHQLPLDGLKIDRSFVRGTIDAAVVQTILTLAQSLGVGVVAEGIEEAGQLAALRDMGCRLGQGFLFSRPLEPASVVPGT